MLNLKYVKADTITARVPVVLSTDEPEKPHEAHYYAKYKQFDRAKFQELMDKQLDDEAFIDEVTVDAWGIDDNGTELKGKDAIAAIKAHLNLSTAHIRQFVKEHTDAEGKNSRRSRGR